MSKPVGGAGASRLTYFEMWLDPVAERVLGARSDIELVRLHFDTPATENNEAMRVAHGYQVLPRTELREPWFCDAKLLARCPNLLAACSTGAGYDVIDVEACTAAGVIVCHQSGTNKEAVAEHALGLMLSLAKKIAVADRALRRQRTLDRLAFTGNDLHGKTLGIIGLGQIGTRLAELCRGLFGMKVLAHDPYLAPQQMAARGADKVGLDQLLARSDFVSVHCPRNRETMEMLGRDQFRQMKPSAYFITTARGGIHREDDLAEALAGGWIAGAGLDVWLHEPPPPEHPLLRFENVIATPHNAGITAEALHDMALGAAEQWIRIFAGEAPPRLVNPEAWPRYAERFQRLLGFRPAALA